MRPFGLFLVASTIFFLADAIRPTSVYDVHQFTAADRTGRMDAAWDKLAKVKGVPKEIIIERVQEIMHRASTAAQIINALAMAAVLALLFHRRYLVEHLVFSLHFLSFTFLGAVLLMPFSPAPGVVSMKGIAVWIGITLAFMAYLFVSMRRVYAQGIVATLFKTIIAYAVTQAVIVMTVMATLIVAMVRAAKAH